MQIGVPQRVIIVEPLELPIGKPRSEPEPEPIQVPEPQQERVHERVG